MDRQRRAVEVLRRLSVACYDWLGPASSWGSLADGNATAIEQDPPFTEWFPQWLRGRSRDWLAFANRTDPELRDLALEASEAIASLALSFDTLGTLFLVPALDGDFIAYHAGTYLDKEMKR